MDESSLGLWRNETGGQDGGSGGVKRTDDNMEGAAALPQVHKATSISVIQLTLPLKLVTLEDSFVCRILLSCCACACHTNIYSTALALYVFFPFFLSLPLPHLSAL